jgi:hypothetical protein
LVESTQIMIGQGRLVCRAVAQRRPRVSKLGLKGPSDYHSSDIAVEAARPGSRRPS